MKVLAGVICGAGTGLGLLLLILGARHQSPAAPRPALRWTPAGAVVAFSEGRTPVRVAGVLAAAAFAGVITRWPVAAIAAGLAAWAVPAARHGSARQRTQQIARLEGLATWTESLAATLSAAAGLEQAIAATARTPPPALAGPLAGLGAALEGGVRLPVALRAFAADMDDPATDTVVAALLLASTQGGASLREPLRLLAAATRDDVTARRLAETGRARVLTDTRLVLAVAAAMITGLIVFNRGFLTPYDTLTGQLVLAVVMSIAAAAVAGLRRLGRHQEPSRVIALTPPAGPGRVSVS
jgi:hypothetical protein